MDPILADDLRSLNEALAVLKLDPRKQKYLFQFCRALRQAKIRLLELIDIYGSSLLGLKNFMAIIREADRILRKGGKISEVESSIRRHIKDVNLRVQLIGREQKGRNPHMSKDSTSNPESKPELKPDFAPFYPAARSQA